jgi:acetyl-CoA/propionyl-CoA carboxylase biotin carboxyl carrier protein
VDVNAGRRSIGRLLIANRGEIALRIMRTCREMGIATIAVYGRGEEQAPHVRAADEAYRLESTNPLPYLDIEAVLAVADVAAADAVHPGYGFLAENARFASAVAAAGKVFVGPSPDAIAAMGDKVEARRIATAAGIGPVPGTADPVATIEQAEMEAERIGFPVAVKAVGGGGGRGFRVARTPVELPEAFAGSTGEAARYFSNPEVYLERYLERPRHIEVQVFADCHGNVVALGERDCSVQRRHQKLIEETPSVAVDPSLRERLNDASVQLARAVDYTGAGTIEYLLAPDGSFYFLEMNTRIQVEHTVTEMVTGIDLVGEQLRVAMGDPLSFTAIGLDPRGWSIECRVNAEDAGRDFAPGPGTITTYVEPVGFGVRVDAALGRGDTVHPAFDSLIAKVVTWGRDRDEARHRMIRALSDYRIEGVPTTIPFHLNVLRSDAFAAGTLSTTFLVDHPEVIPAPAPAPNGVLEEPVPPTEMVVEVNGKRFETRVFGSPPRTAVPGNRPPKRARRGRHVRSDQPSATGNEVRSPVQGTVIRLAVAAGDVVVAGQVICVVEAMKMENDLTAPRSGVIDSLSVVVGSSVGIGEIIATVMDSAG